VAFAKLSFPSDNLDNVALEPNLRCTKAQEDGQCYKMLHYASPGRTAAPGPTRRAGGVFESATGHCEAAPLSRRAGLAGKPMRRFAQTSGSQSESNRGVKAASFLGFVV